MGPILTTLAAAAICSGAALFLVQPLRRFYDLREECREQMLYFANVRLPDTGESDEALREHQRVVRRLGTRMSGLRRHPNYRGLLSEGSGI
jgi:hypothetical protein